MPSICPSVQVFRKRNLRAGPESQALHDGAGQGFRLFNARGFFANSTHADAREGVDLQHVESAGDRIADPVGIFAKPANRPRLASLLIAFRSLQTSIFSLAEALRPPAFAFSGEPLCTWPAASAAADKINPQDNTRMMSLQPISFSVAKRDFPI